MRVRPTSTALCDAALSSARLSQSREGRGKCMYIGVPPRLGREECRGEPLNHTRINERERAGEAGTAEEPAPAGEFGTCPHAAVPTGRSGSRNVVSRSLPPTNAPEAQARSSLCGGGAVVAQGAPLATPISSSMPSTAASAPRISAGPRRPMQPMRKEGARVSLPG